MKRLVILLLAIGLYSGVSAQLKVTAKCDPFVVDVLNGTVNKVKANYTAGEIKDKFPCFTSAEDESQTAKCGGGVYFKDKDVSFFTQRDYIEIGPNFKGKLSIPLLGAKQGSLFKLLGSPQLKDATWEAYQTAYGILVLHYSAGKVKYFQMSTENATTIKLCE
jgi:hypothetical protein